MYEKITIENVNKFENMNYPDINQFTLSRVHGIYKGKERNIIFFINVLILKFTFLVTRKDPGKWENRSERALLEV